MIHANINTIPSPTVLARVYRKELTPYSRIPMPIEAKNRGT